MQNVPGAAAHEHVFDGVQPAQRVPRGRGVDGGGEAQRRLAPRVSVALALRGERDSEWIEENRDEEKEEET